MTREKDAPSGVGRLVIRGMRPGDYDTVRRLWEEAGLPFRPKGRDSRQRVATELERETAVFLVAEVDGEPAGVVFGTHDGRKGWINRLAVAPTHQGHGIARSLVREVEARLASRGIEITAALIETPNAASLAFFKAIGYAHDPDIEYMSRRRSTDT